MTTAASLNVTIRKYPDIMLDMETLGTVPGSLIMSIGAVPFDRKSKVIEDELYFYQNVSVEDGRKKGYIIEEDTLKWWQKQPKEAWDMLQQDVAPVFNALLNFKKFVLYMGEKNVRIWARGPSFDASILGAAYRKEGIDAPWKFYNERCHRTNVEDFEKIEPKFNGIPHYAIDDCIHQINWMFNE